MKKNWLDSNTWFNKNISKENDYKKSTLCALAYININSSGKSPLLNPLDDFPLEFLLKDIDIVAFLLKHYLLDKQILSNPIFKEHLENVDKAYYIVKHGMPKFVTEHILSLYPYFSTDIDIVKNVIEATPNLTSLFSEYISKRRNVDKLLKINVINERFLNYYPQDYIISKKLIEKRVYPYGEYQKLYNSDVLNDKSLILSSIPKQGGNYLYRNISERLQYDKDICELMTTHHPYEEIKKIYINNMDDFLKSLESPSPFATEINVVLGNIKKLSFIIEDIDNLILAFKAIVDKNCDSYIDLMAGPAFSDHPFQEFLLSIRSTNNIINEFVSSDIGKKYINFSINNYETYMEYEQKIMPLIGNELFIFYEHFKLENQLINKNSSHPINKA